MSVLNHTCDDQPECPLCMEAFEVDDLNFFPCTCGYQICRFCWHRIRTDENGLCPACRKPYPEDPADFKPLSREEVAKLKAEKRHKHQQKKNKITEDRKVLNNMRVLQKNLVFVVGLPNRISEAETLKKHEYFGKFGKILKVVINQSTSYIGTQGPSASAYVTYSRCEDALRAILAVNNVIIDNRVLKASLGTTKYCSNFMKNQPCPKTDCMYLHEMGEPEASFTKDEMQQGKHQEYEKKLYEQYNVVLSRRPENSPPIQNSSSSNIGAIENLSQNNKESWPSLNNGISRIQSPVEDDRLYEVDFNLTNHNSHSEKTLEKCESQNIKINGHKNQKKSNSPENRKGKVKTPSSIPSAEEEQLNTLEGECTENKRNLIKEIWNTEPSLSNNVSENDTQNESLFENPQKPTSIFEQDNNNSFFSSNFSKLTNGKTSPVLNNEPEWNPPVSAILPPIPDVLPQVQTSEDWQAAFGFSNSNNSRNNYQSSDINRSMLNLPTDEDIFDSVSATQRALSEYMEQQNHINLYQSRLQNSGFPYCTKLMDNLHINNTAPTRTCLPPPGFSSANQVNSYGISIPRNTGNTNKLPQNNPFALQQQLRQSSSHNLDWSSIDPAIVTATPHCNLYTTPPPPPGFNMRQPFDSNLWLFNNLI